MSQYRKKPVVIEAYQNTPQRGVAPAWLREALASGSVRRDETDTGRISFIVKTLEGEMRAEPGDWFIRGVKGEIYPCKPDIFEMTYEEVA